MTGGLTVDQRADGVVVVAGELSLTEAAALERRLSEVLATTDGQQVVLDLAGVAFIDSTGLGVLVRAHRAASQRGIRLAVRNPGPQAQRLLTLTGLEAHLTLPKQTPADQGSAGSKG
jgi:anti-anti-sigma factor